MQSVGESLPESLAIRQLRELGELNLAQNNMDGYLAVQQEITRRYPQSSAARSAAEVLLIFYSSAETRRYRLQNELQSPVSKSTLGGPGGTATPQLSGAFSSNSSSQLDALNERWDQHAETAYRVLTHQPAETDTEVNRSVSSDRTMRGDILLRLAANFRNQGTSGEHSALLAEVSRMPEPFGRFARAEMQITHAAAVPELPTFNVPRRKETPFLDGTLTDTMWEAAEEIRLQEVSAAPGGQALATDRPTQRSDFGEASSLVMLGSDDEHLYVTGVFELGENSQQKVTLATHRRHDASHELKDRFELEIDTDRDYSTAFHFCVDEAGLTSEKCWLLDRWDPQWYVSVKRDAQTWRFEAAIPLRELSIRQPPLGTVWRISLRRIQPGAHHMELASGDRVSANGNGLMRFIRPKAATPSSKKR
jgi:hypothetical protein